MLKASGTVAVLALAGTGAMAGGVERSTQSVAILFEDGNYAQFSLGAVVPDVSGSFAGVTSGNMSGDYLAYSLGYKQSLSPSVDLAIILDQPIGASVNYPKNNYALAGTTASLDSNAVTGLLRYKLPSATSSFFSVIGGIRLESASGSVKIQTQAPLGTSLYNLDTNTDYQPGYVLGLAWERPDIAARVAVTYNSAITHTLQMDETSSFGPFPGPSASTEQDVEVPQSVNVEFQTGVAKDTLLFGSVRWVDWTQFVIDPPVYNGIYGPNPLVSYQHDRTTYNIGLGHQFNENWSGAVTLAYEPSNGDVTGNLGPVDGFTAVGVGATYAQGNVKVTGGVRYLSIGGANTTLGAKFRDNSGVGAGIQVGFSF